MARGTPRPRLRASVLVLTALVLLYSASPAVASGSSCRTISCARAQDGRQKRDESLLEKVGLGSLEDVPWSSFPVGLALAALIGLAGGFIYSGLVGPPPRRRKKEPD